jgi:transcriptional regulator with XRE-family HTH domain
MRMIGRAIKRWREHLGLTQEDLATRARMSQELVSRYEHGKVKGMPCRRLEQIASGLKIPLHELFKDTDVFPVESNTELRRESI